MTVRELRKFLETCDQDIQVTVIAPDDELGFSVCYGVANVKQIKPYSLHDEPEWPNVVEIEIRK